ncbi:magnesium transporter nipa [Cystoisospora suis]|uniref:Magnesium transporter nipa n=1 Tax=Cystoisospora suis TaxID=483139 RepID=A0A2C6KE31_9APIC|nr:magnesium transporter nipa [Cystoisospora suis]
MADESTVSHLWYIGVIVVALGSLAGAGGDTMVRHAYVKAGNDATPKQMLKSPMFVVGMLLTVVLDPLCTFVALLFAPSSIVTPFAGVHIFWAVFIAHFWLKEHMGWVEVLGSIGIVTGVILMVCFCGTEADIGSISAFDSYASTPGAIAYIAVSAFLLIVILILAFSFYPCSLGSWDYSVRRLATALASGFLGGNSNVSAKFFSIILMDLFAGHTSVFTNWRTYVVTLCTVVLCLGQLIFLNVSLRRYEAIYVVPTINSCLVAEGTIGSILVLHEVPKNWTAFSIGLILCIAGILILTTAHKIQPLHKKTLSLEMKTPSQEMGAMEAGEAAGTIPEAKMDEEGGIATTLEKSPSKNRLSSLTRSFSRSATAVMDMSIVLNSKAFYSMYTIQEHHLPVTDDVPGMLDSSCSFLFLSLLTLFSPSYHSLYCIFLFLLAPRFLFLFLTAISSVFFFSLLPVL